VNKQKTEIALDLRGVPGSLDLCLPLPMTETAGATLGNQRKHRQKKQKSVGMYDRFSVLWTVTFPRQFMKGVYEWEIGSTAATIQGNKDLWV
jgi:hypothetical protein